MSSAAVDQANGCQSLALALRVDDHSSGLELEVQLETAAGFHCVFLPESCNRTNLFVPYKEFRISGCI